MQNVSDIGSIEDFLRLPKDQQLAALATSPPEAFLHEIINYPGKELATDVFDAAFQQLNK